MSNIIEEDEDDEDWEDDPAHDDILKQLPEGWVLIKVVNYTAATLLELDDWLAENCTQGYRKVNWSGGCSYSTGIMVEGELDAILCRLRWSY